MKRIKKIVKKICIPIMRCFYHIMTFLHIWKPSYVVIIDGGISSQINQYILGVAIKKLFPNVNVVYDLSWYRRNGMDLDNKYIRNFDLLRMLPFIDVKTFSRLEEIIYRHCFFFYTKWREYISFNITNLPPAPLYLAEYGYLVPKHLKKEIIEDTFSLVKPDVVLNLNSLEVYGKIQQSQPYSVGIHVRRGDMAKEGFNFIPLMPKYFIDAISLLCFKNAHYFFFSDEIEWVRKEVLTRLPNDYKYSVIDFNGSDKGYMDLYLCSCCNHVIASQGSMGILATELGMLNHMERIIVVPKYRLRNVKDIFSDESNISVVGI